MVDNRKISLAITTWNRTDMLFESFVDVLYDERISEIVISDDCSKQDIYNKIVDFVKWFPKIKLHRNTENQDCYKNKRTAIGLASNDWVIIFDSDNIIDVDYLDRIFSVESWDDRMIYAPDFAQPHFNYTEFSGLTIMKENVGKYIDRPMFMTGLNTFNFFINRNEYLKVWDGNIDPVTSDSEYFNTCWLKSGRKLHFLKGLQYFHRVHGDSHFQKNTHRTGNLPNEIKKQLMELT